MNAQQHFPDSTPVTLVNILPEDFTFHWAKVPYVLAKGASMRLPKWMARHAAKHMADRWYGLQKGQEHRNRHAEDAFVQVMASAIKEGDGGAPHDPVAAEVAILNEPARGASAEPASPQEEPVTKNLTPKLVKAVLCAECGAQGKRHKPGCSKHEVAP